MSDNPSSEHDLPRYCCPECTSLRVAGEPTCATCGRSQPESGWFPLSECPDPFLGRIIDERFLVTKREASGGHATVYRAQLIGTNRVVALKVARIGEPDSMGDDRLRKRMSREVRAVRMLESSHIVTIHEFIELESGSAVIVMDYVSGRTAENLVEAAGPFRFEHALVIFRQVASGLAAAHSAGLLHRDIKPANVMIEDPGDQSSPPRSYVTDFGVVRMHAASTLTKGFIGTPLYASPEQIRMEELDSRTDVYSLGATLFYLLSGNPPYYGDAMMEVMRAHLEAPIPSVSSACEAGPVPDGIDALLSDMLAKDRADRPDDASEVLQRLNRVELEASQAFAPTSSLEDATSPGVQPLSAPSTHSEVSVAAESSAVEDSASGEVDEEADSSGSFTPMAHSTSDFEPIPNDTNTNEFDFERDDESSGTKIGVQPVEQFDEERHVNANRSVQFWEDETEISSVVEEEEVTGENPGLTVCDAWLGCRFIAVDGDRTTWLFEPASDVVPTFVAQHAARAVDAALGAGQVWVALSTRAVQRVGLQRHNRSQCLVTEARITNIVATNEGVVGVGTDTGVLHWKGTDDQWRHYLCREPIEVLAAAPSAPIFATASREGPVDVLNVSGAEPDVQQLEFRLPISALGLAPSGSLLAALSPNGRLSMRHVSSGREIEQLDLEPGAYDMIFFSPEGDLHGVERDGQRVVVRDVHSDDVIEQFVAVAPGKGGR